MNANEQQREIDRLEREELWLRIQAINIHARLAATAAALRLARKNAETDHEPQTERKE